MPELVLKNISKKYGGVEALRNVDLHIQDGEFCMIVGPSGSGKTTLLNIIAGFIEPDNGEIIVDGRVYNELSHGEKNIGMVFQDIGLFSHMTVRNNISFGLEIKKLKKEEIKKRVEEIATRLQISQILDKKPDLLSGGEAQRVAIGRTLITNPSFFLFDEPLGNLDADLRLSMLTEIKRMHLNMKKTFIFVTHDQEQALSAASRVVIMKEGRVVQEGDTRKVYNLPVNRFVAEFFGISPMNFIEGIIIPQENGSIFKGSGLSVSLPYYVTKETEVTLGIRPVDVLAGNQFTESHGTGTVKLIEILGDKNQLYLGLKQEKPIIAITPPMAKFKFGEKVGIKFKENKIFLFDKEKGGRIYP